MSPRKATSIEQPGPAPTLRNRSTRPSAIASSSRQTLDGPAPTETRQTGSSRTTNKSAPLTAPEVGSPKVIGKGKGKASASSTIGTQSSVLAQQSKRVLPARLRRAAGGGQDGVRDLEEMIVDWLDRYGYPSDSPPEDLRITITSLPLDLVDPPPYTVGPAVHTERITITPHPNSNKVEQEVIETPDWVMVKAGEDDQEEAREELSTNIPVSPVRRLRVLNAVDDHTEDTSDEHYIRLHKKYEAFEKRQRKDERDKLAFERYKMRTRIDLLRGMSLSAWSAVVWTVMAREDHTGTWTKGKEMVRAEGVDWLRRRLVREGEEVMKRYDQLLPSDSRRARMVDSRTSTPARSVVSASPPPAVLPARVAALKDPTISQRRRSLPAHMNGVASETTRKRQRQQSTKSQTPPKLVMPRSKPIKPISATFSDSDSDPLSELSSESGDESQDEQIMTEPSTPVSPASTTTTTTNTTTGTPSVRKITLRVTRAGTNVVPPKKAPTRTSARLSHVTPVAITDPGPVKHIADTEVIETPRELESDSSTVVDPVDQTSLYPSPPADIETQSGPLSEIPKVEAEVTADEQLEIDRVEAAVII